MRFVHHFHAFGRGHQHQCFDVFAAFFLQQIDGGHHGAAGGQHWIDNQGRAFVHIVDKFFKIRHRLHGFFVALQTHHADFGGGNQIQHAIKHTQTGAQNRHDGNGFAFDAVRFDVAAPALQGKNFGGKIAAGFIGHQPRQLFGEGAEAVGAAIGFAHQA